MSRKLVLNDNFNSPPVSILLVETNYTVQKGLSQMNVMQAANR